MAAINQSRINGEADPDNSALAATRPGARGAVMTLRLWTANDTGEPDPQFWTSAVPAVWLVTDLITASDGVVASTHDRRLIASFAGIDAALAAARRLQWALQGFSETPGQQETALAILVETTEQAPSPEEAETFLGPLDNVAQGQILLTEETCLLLDDLPGFSLQDSTGNGMRELLWRASGNDSALASDEAHLAQWIKENTPEVVPEPAPEPTPEFATPSTDFTGRAGSSSYYEPAPAAPARGKQGLMIGAACLVALGIVLALVLGHKSTSAQPTPAPVADTGSKTPAPITNTVTEPVQPAAKPPEQARDNGKSGRPEKESAKDKKGKKGDGEMAAAPVIREEEHERPAARGQNCDYEQSEIAGVIDGAESALARGRYPDAERQFRAALECEPHNGRALSGLNRVKAARDAGSAR